MKLTLLKKRSAIEMSMNTVIILIIAVSMLALGLVLVRRIMCGAIGLTGTSMEKAQKAIDKLFEEQGGDFQCLGGGGEPPQLIPGKTHYIWCSFSSGGTYTFTLEEANKPDERIQIGSLISNWRIEVSPGDTSPKRIFSIFIPKDAREGDLIIPIKVTKDGNVAWGPNTLIYRIKRAGFLQGAI